MSTPHNENFFAPVLQDAGRVAGFSLVLPGAFLVHFATVMVNDCFDKIVNLSDQGREDL